jgi:uncharacterized Tic20 family protein
MNQAAVSEDEKTWAILAHLSALLSIFTAFVLGPLAAFAIWLIKKDQSRYVGFQALQSLVYQIVAAVVNWVMWITIAILTVFVVGCLCIPFGIVISLASVAYPLYAAYRCSMGEDFRYVLIADLIAPKPTPGGPMVPMRTLEPPAPLAGAPPNVPSDS